VETRESVNELVDHTLASIAGGRLECASDIVMLRASELAHAIKCRDVSCCEVMQAYLKHIDRLNPIVHALRLGVEQAELIALAYHRDTQLRRGEYLGWMHGLPTVIRENRDAAACALVARRMKNAGCIIVGEANQSLSVSDCDCEYRPVAMPLNAYDQRKTAGGGAASAAVALALRMLPVADGSDPAMSLQNACAFNNVLGFRPSAGRTLPETQQLLAPTFAARGLMARSVRDLARLFLVQSGYNDRP
jgi:amidase